MPAALLAELRPEPAAGGPPPQPAHRCGPDSVRRSPGRCVMRGTRGSTAATTMSATMFATTTASEKSRKIACSSGTSGPRSAW